MLLSSGAQADESQVPAVCQETVLREPGEWVVVAVISPRMVYAMTEWPRMRRAALKEGYRVLAWRSSEAGDAEWRDASRRAGWDAADTAAVSRVPSGCVDWIGHPNHFPFVRVVDAHGKASWPIWGVLPDADWQESLRYRRGGVPSRPAGGGR